MHGGRGSGGSGAACPDDQSIRLTLLGGFQAEITEVVPESAWQQRRSAKQLVKLLAISPGHSLHREQVLELLWPDVEFSSGLNSLGKALHVARRVLEPSMLSRGASSYLRLVDDVLTLVSDDIWIDAEMFQRAADASLRAGDRGAIEATLELYKGDLLPEDTYESWTMQPRTQLADLRVRLLLAHADISEKMRDRDTAIQQLNQILSLDAAREDIHRRLMKMYAESGRRLLALRQYQMCCDALERELDAEPDSTTLALIEDIRADRVPQDEAAEIEPVSVPVAPRSLPEPLQQVPPTPFIGRGPALSKLMELFESVRSGHGRTVVVHGETGVGKTRLVTEAARNAAQEGAVVLWGATHDNESSLPYGPFLQALEVYAATRDVSERETLASSYPELTPYVSSLTLGIDNRHDPLSSRVDQGRLFSAIVRLLTDLAAQHPVVVVLDDIHSASWETVRLFHHIAHLAGSRRWLVLGSYREEEISTSSGLDQVLSSLTRQNLCSQVRLELLTRDECDTLVTNLVHQGTPAEELLDYVYTMTLGNPLFILELLGALQGRGQLDLRDGRCYLSSPAPSQVPVRIRKLLQLRIRDLDQRSQQVLTLLATFETPPSFDTVYAVAQEVIDPNLVPAELLDSLDAALQSQVIAEGEAGYVFVYPLFHLAVADRLSQQRRQQYQRAIARVDSTPAQASELSEAEAGSKAALERAVQHLERGVIRAQADSSRVDEEMSLWRLLEGLQMLGRGDEAERVRQHLRTLLRATSPYGTTAGSDEYPQVEHGIA